MIVRELARAKVNLTLQVLGRRSDGFHALASLVAFADFGDEITLDTSVLGMDVEVTGPFAAKLANEFLIDRTLRLVAQHHPNFTLGKVTLNKRLPIAAGVGGGSADAAAVLRAVRAANGAAAEAADWNGLAAQLGSDVPVCFANRWAFMTGTGDRVTVLEPPDGRIEAVLVNPLVDVPDDKTAQVFRALDAAPVADETLAPPVLRDKAGVLSAIAEIGNALQVAASLVVPASATVLSVLREIEGCQIASLSGAGPTCFGIFENAQAAAAQLQTSQPSWWVQAVTLG